MAYFVLSSAVGVDVFVDQNDVLMNERSSADMMFGSMKAIARFRYQDARHADMLPFDLNEWWDSLVTGLAPRSRTARWFFAGSQILSQLVHDRFGISVFCLSCPLQRVVTEVAAALLNVEQGQLNELAAATARQVYESLTAEVPYDEEENQNEEET